MCFFYFFDIIVVFFFSFFLFFSFSFFFFLILFTSIVVCAFFAYILNPKTHTASQTFVLSFFLSFSSFLSSLSSLSQTFFLSSTTSEVFLVSESKSLNSNSEFESNETSMSLLQLRSSSLMSSRMNFFFRRAGFDLLLLSRERGFLC